MLGAANKSVQRQNTLFTSQFINCQLIAQSSYSQLLSNPLHLNDSSSPAHHFHHSTFLIKRDLTKKRSNKDTSSKIKKTTLISRSCLFLPPQLFPQSSTTTTWERLSYFNPSCRSYNCLDPIVFDGMATPWPVHTPLQHPRFLALHLFWYTPLPS